MKGEGVLLEFGNEETVHVVDVRIEAASELHRIVELALTPLDKARFTKWQIGIKKPEQRT